MQAAALHASLRLLAAVPSERLPLAAFLDAALRALRTWVEAGSAADHPLFPEWSRRLVALLHVLSCKKAPGSCASDDVAALRLCQVREQVGITLVPDVQVCRCAVRNAASSSAKTCTRQCAQCPTCRRRCPRSSCSAPATAQSGHSCASSCYQQP